MNIFTLFFYLFKILDFFIYIYLITFKKKFFFTFNNKKYLYFYHLYNHTFRNERIVEIPIIYEEIRGKNFPDFLEVGNVLNHYFRLGHDVVDKYEKGKNVKNIDIINYKTTKKYDMIISISTIEHIGFDESEKDRIKVIETINLLKNLLIEGGKLIITVPLGYNDFLDKLIINNFFKFNNIFYFKREEKRNIWHQIENIQGYKIEFVKGKFYFYAKYLVLMYFFKK